MKRYEAIQLHPVFLGHVKRLTCLEKDRVFCRHDLSHFLDVARLMRIYDLEEKKDLGCDLIYGAALIHDLGRVEQYEEGRPHDEASCELAYKILPECGYSSEEIALITYAVAGHRSAGEAKEALIGPEAEISSEEPSPEAALLRAYLKRADKKSRPCFLCPAREECHWPEEKKNERMEL